MDPLEEQLEAYNSRDVERFVACFAADVVVQDAAGAVLATGVDSVRQAYAQLFANSPDLHARIGQRIRVGDYVIDEEFVTGITAPGFPADGLHAAVVYHIVDGKIARMQQFR